MAIVGFGNPSLGVQTGNSGPKESMQEMFIELSNTPGSSTDSRHAGWIDVHACSFGAHQSTSAQTGGGSSVGKALFEDFSFVKFVDKATPNLLKHCASGKHLDKLVLSVCKSGGEQQEYMKVTLKEVFITSVNMISNTESPRMMEKVTCSYGEVSVECKDQKADGSLGAAVTGGWNVKQNKAA